MELKETYLSGETRYEGVIVDVRMDKVKLLDDTVTNREVVEHPGGVAIFAIDEENRVVMVRQYRYPVGEVTLELPAGKLEPGEDPRESALRELEEETGIRPGRVTYMGLSYSSPGIFTERIHLYLAQDLVQGQSHPDEGEFVDVVRLPLSELLDMIRDNKLPDAKSALGILKGAMLLNHRK